MLADAGQHADIRRAAQFLPDAMQMARSADAIAEQRYSDAATLYDEIGSRPLAADAHLLAVRQAIDEGRTVDAHRHVQAVFEFARQTGAALYQQRAEALVRASA